MGFESALHQLKQGARGSRNRPEQMVRSFLVTQAAPEPHHHDKTFKQSSELPDSVLQSHPQAASLAREKGAVAYQGRFLLSGRTLFSIMYTRGSARSSHFLHYSLNGDNSFGEAVFYFTDATGEMFCAMKQLEVLRSLFDSLDGPKKFPHARTLSEFHFVCRESDIYCSIPVHCILSRCCVLPPEMIDTLPENKTLTISPIVHNDYELQ